MATTDQLTTKATERKTRYFSEDFKRKKVEELDRKITTLAQICKQYSVSSTAVYKWIYKYSLMRKKGIKMVVEAQSDTVRIAALTQHIARLEQLLGQKQFEVDFLQKQLDMVSEHYGVDLKKKASGPPSPGFGSSEANTPTK